jgi:uncharacterized SAM-binding protein YcdF (DUF218 family)
VTRVIVVLGFSTGGANELHPVCAARLAAAAAISGPTDVVVLSGWGRTGRGRSEAELMRDAWHGSAAEVVVDPDARTTVENLANALNDILRVGAHEVVVVTSSWHAPRAKAAMRWLLLHTGIKVTSESPTSDSPYGGSPRASLRELPLWALLPFQLWHAGRKSWSV